MKRIVGLPRAPKNLEKTNTLGSNNKSVKLDEVAQLEFYRDSFKHVFLVFFEVL